MAAEDDIYKNLVTFLKLFKNRPYHLAKFLIEKGAFTKKFQSDIMTSQKLNLIGLDEPKSLNPVNFNNFTQMEDYYNSFFERSEINSKTKAEIEEDLNKKLEDLLKSEQYEEAASLRDYMLMKGYKRIPKK